MSLSLPFLGMSQMVLLASAVFLLLLWGLVFGVTQYARKQCPSEKIEPTGLLSKYGLFRPAQSGLSDRPSEPTIAYLEVVSE